MLPDAAGATQLFHPNTTTNTTTTFAEEAIVPVFLLTTAEHPPEVIRVEAAYYGIHSTGWITFKDADNKALLDFGPDTLTRIERES